MKIEPVYVSGTSIAIESRPIVGLTLNLMHPCTPVQEAQPCLEHGGGDVGKPSSLSFPQAEDECSPKAEQTIPSIDPWAPGRVTCSLKGGITGLRPVKNQYSIVLSGPSQWQAHNLNIFQQSDEKISDAQITADRARRCVEQSYKAADQTQLETTDCLKTRANLVHRYKTELEHAIVATTEEIGLLEAERRRVQQSLSVLTVPTSIAGEFLQLRCSRLESDLVRDAVEDQLVQEVTLCAEVRDLLNRTLEQIKLRMIELKTVKASLENDWSDKTDTYNIESVCVNLSNDSSQIMWRAGSTRFPAVQSTPTSHEHFTQEGLNASETARKKSADLRSNLNKIYIESIKSLRDQATRVDVALEEKVKLTQDVLRQLEVELLRCLQELANTEKLIEELRGSTKGLNNAMKLAQTRLDNRLLRRSVENCRDIPQFTLIEEVKSLGERISAVLEELKRAEKSHAELIETRSILEHEIIVKRKTLYIDKEQGLLLRSRYPSAVALSGY
ncbi:PREDICTED: tektin-4 [Dinoponera quadriceps]|uniref:Tektin n=1 Tax=Dinoponera quadriceps TaxID=609295 RepID=A0A6P3Y5U2_DINQU|nr:PREDICTED: tektin-4 [Dinoponera quadriceps]